MLKAWDLQDLIGRYKAKGLEAAEKVAKIVASETMDWAAESCLLSEKSYIKFGASLIGGAKPLVMQALDKIDGKVDAA